MDLTGKVVGHRFRVHRRVGAGGMSVTFLARDDDSREDLLLRVPHPSLWKDSRFRTRFVSETQPLVGRRFDGFPEVRAVGVEDDTPWFAVAHLPAGSLNDRLRELPDGQHLGAILPWLLRIADRLDWLHDAAIVHRDVKPVNILFSSDRQPALSDFVIPRILRHFSVDLALAGQQFTAAGYAPPEIVEGKFAPAYDQFALAACAFRALTGKPPHAFQAILGMETVLTGHLPAAAIDVFQRALAVAPEGRYPTCSEFARSLMEAAFGPIRAVSKKETMFVRPPGRPAPAAEPTQQEGKR